MGSSPTTEGSCIIYWGKDADLKMCQNPGCSSHEIHDTTVERDCRGLEEELGIPSS